MIDLNHLEKYRENTDLSTVHAVVIKEDVSTAPVPAANACVVQVLIITPATVAHIVAFLATRVNLESHLCLGSVEAVVSIAAVSTAEIFSSFIGKKSPQIK